jgi:hypothetical protein
MILSSNKNQPKNRRSQILAVKMSIKGVVLRFPFQLSAT